jgi:hypothetical protein
VGFLDRFRTRAPSVPSELVGCWRLVESADGQSEPTEAEFRADGRLHYSVLSGDRWQIMKLVYRVEGNVIVTDQPSSPHEERTRFTLQADGSLVLEFGGQCSRFRRAPKVAPEA